MLITTNTHQGRRRPKTRVVQPLPVPGYDPAAIKTLREHYNISQMTLAILLNTGVSTVSQWEIGVKRPSGTATKLLNILERKGIEALI